MVQVFLSVSASFSAAASASLSLYPVNYQQNHRKNNKAYQYRKYNPYKLAAVHVVVSFGITVAQSAAVGIATYCAASLLLTVRPLCGGNSLRPLHVVGFLCVNLTTFTLFPMILFITRFICSGSAIITVSGDTKLE